MFPTQYIIIIVGLSENSCCYIDIKIQNNNMILCTYRWDICEYAFTTLKYAKIFINEFVLYINSVCYETW